jgi:DNA-binding transcriptional ArsR family regulator
MKHEPAEMLFRTLGDPTRRALFERLAREGESSVHRLTTGSGVSQPMVSRHLAALNQAGLVIGRREGRETRYRARPEGLSPLLGWMALYGAFWDDHFDALESLLKRMDQ